MSEIKTLKDIPIEGITMGFVDSKNIKYYSEEQLKEEAIKWVKNLQSKYDKEKNKDICRIIVGEMKSLIRFFNITEEDLK